MAYCEAWIVAYCEAWIVAYCEAWVVAYCEAWIVAYWGWIALNAVPARTLAAAPLVRIPDLALSLVLEDTVPFTYTTSGSLLFGHF